MSLQELRYVLAGGVQFQDAMTKSRSDRVLAFFLHFDSEDPVFAVHAVSAISDGLQHFFAERSETSVSELKQLITTAKDKLMPELNALEAEYRKFQENTELTFDKSGEMVNPYREKQLALQGRRLSIEDDMRDLTTKLSAIQSTMQSSTDPMLVMEVVHQLLGEELFAVRKLVETETGFENGTRMAPMKRDEDLSLAKLTIERTLLPMEVERQQFASSFGTGHPSVRQLDQQISATREKLNELTAQENRRLMELKKEELLPSDELMKVRRERAEMAVGGFVKALETRRAVLLTQLEMLDEQVVNLSDQAAKLARAESDNAMYLRRIGRAQKLLDSVEEQMTKINLADQKASIHVSQLNPPSPAGLVAPILSKYLLVGGMLGGMLGLGLVYLLESQSKTFRSSEEVSRFLGIRVLSHVPTDTRTLPKTKKGEKYPFASIDPGLASIHRPRSTTAEAVRRLRTSVFLEAAAADAKVIQVTSALPGDGKSTLSGNLGISIARSGKTVVIVDADLRLPQMTASFSMSDKDGLTDLIDGTCDPSQVIHPTAIENLWIVPCGPIPTNPAEALSMSQFNDFLAWLKERYDYVIVDTPPLLVVTDPSIVASAVDGIVFTFRIRRGSKPQSKEAISMLRAIGTPILGAVINRVDQTTKASGYQGYHTSSYYNRRYHSAAPASNGVASAGDLSGEGRLINPRPTKTVGDNLAKFDRLVKVEE
jgi:succinoglycan biosynthesis transport protein ExoP